MIFYSSFNNFKTTFKYVFKFSVYKESAYNLKFQNRDYNEMKLIID